MKEKILSGLQKAIEASNEKITLDARTINDYAANISVLVTDESQLTEQFYAIHLGIIKSVNGNVNHVIAAQVEEAKKNLVNPLTPPITPLVTPPVVTPNDAILAKLNEISERQNKIEQAGILATKQEQRNQLLESIRKTATTKDVANEKSGWATNAGLLTNALALISIEDTDTAESISKKCQDKYNAMATEIFGKSDAVPGVGGGGNAGEISADERAKAISENQKQYRNQQV